MAIPFIKPKIITIFMLLYLEILPGSLQYLHRTRRQIVFPGETNRGSYGSRNSPCVTPDRRNGNCVRISSCPPLMNMANNYNRLRRYMCGFENNEPKVCCPVFDGDGGNDGGGRERIPPTTPRPTRRPQPTRRVVTNRPPATRPPTRRPPPVDVRETPRPPTGGRGNTAFLPQSCGVSVVPKIRVVGGQEAKHGSWPWMAVIYQVRRGVRTPECGGTLVTTQHVITAAHCVVGRRSTTLSPDVLSIRLGEHDLYNNSDGMNPVDVDVISVVKHENFNPRNYKNDIAVLKLARRVSFNNDIRPICLPYDSLTNDDLTGKSAFVAGWGTTSFNGPSSPVLMEVSFDVQDQDECVESYKNDLPITEEYICAGTLEGDKDACQGDSGGPLMAVGEGAKFYLIGVVSFGKLCATPGYAGVYTRVTKYLDWLRPHLSN